MNGQPKPTYPAVLALVEEVVTATATVTRVVATPTILTMLGTTIRFAHFYICRAELCENQNYNNRKVVLI